MRVPRLRFLALALCLASVSLAAGVVKPAATTSAAPAVPSARTWLRQDAPGGASYLKVPAGCAARSCPLVVVSHPRGQTAERLRDSPQVNVLISALLAANFAVLLYGEGGPTSWGSAQSLWTSASSHLAAVNTFAWNGHTYALGLSMGGLLALRSALPGAPYPVQGVALIDAWVNLEAAWNSAQSRRSEIEAAYGLAGPLSSGDDPLELAFMVPALPLFIVSSPDDRVVPAAPNAVLLSTHARPGVSEIVTLTGAHMGGNRFTPELAGRLVAFLQRLERLALNP